MARADVMVSDWSGVATEFAIATGRPVYYLDGTPKQRNHDPVASALPAFEVTSRARLGGVFPDIEHVPFEDGPRRGTSAEDAERRAQALLLELTGVRQWDAEALVSLIRDGTPNSLKNAS